MDFQFSFTHRVSGKHVITQSWNEFFKLQSDSNYSSERHLGLLPQRHSYAINTIEWNRRSNKFWQGAKGCEKIGEVDCNGEYYRTIFTGLQLWMRNIKNIAAMEGSKRVYDLMRTNATAFYNNGSVYIPCLPQHID